MCNSPGTPIGTGTSFLANHNLVRGFKVHASVVDPLATTLVAQSIDIETAKFDGAISASLAASPFSKVASEAWTATGCR